MGLLVLLVNESVLGRASASAQLSIVILSDLLVGLLRGLGTSALDRLGNVVGGVLCDVSSKLDNPSSKVEVDRQSCTLTVSIVKKRVDDLRISRSKLGNLTE